jgi:hypothetical protein
LVALAGVGPAHGVASERFVTAVERLGHPDHDEVLVIVGAFGAHAPDTAVLEDLARAYSAVVIVLVGAAPSPSRDAAGSRWQADSEWAGSRGVLEIGSASHQELGGRSKSGVLAVPLPLGRSLPAAWSSDLEDPELVEDPDGQLSGVRQATR